MPRPSVTRDARGITAAQRKLVAQMLREWRALADLHDGLAAAMEAVQKRLQAVPMGSDERAIAVIQAKEIATLREWLVGMLALRAKREEGDTHRRVGEEWRKLWAGLRKDQVTRWLMDTRGTVEEMTEVSDEQLAALLAILAPPHAVGAAFGEMRLDPATVRRALAYDKFLGALGADGCVRAAEYLLGRLAGMGAKTVQRAATTAAAEPVRARTPRPLDEELRGKNRGS